MKLIAGAYEAGLYGNAQMRLPRMVTDPAGRPLFAEIDHQAEGGSGGICDRAGDYQAIPGQSTDGAVFIATKGNRWELAN